jgi:hypothetical protein
MVNLGLSRLGDNVHTCIFNYFSTVFTDLRSVIKTQELAIRFIEVDNITLSSRMPIAPIMFLRIKMATCIFVDTKIYIFCVGTATENLRERYGTFPGDSREMENTRAQAAKSLAGMRSLARNLNEKIENRIHRFGGGSLTRIRGMIRWTSLNLR